MQALRSSLKFLLPGAGTEISGAAARHRPVRDSLAPLLARILLSAIFVQGALGKILGWSGQLAYMQRHGIGFTAPLLGVALFIEAVGVVCLLTGLAARLAALVMLLYLVAVSVLLHPFWSAPEALAGARQTEFLKNMAICGGLLLLAVHGPGRWRLHSRVERRAG